MTEESALETTENVEQETAVTEGNNQSMLQQSNSTLHKA